MGDCGKFPVDPCLDSSYDMLPLPDIVGVPVRSANGCPYANQSFSTRAWRKSVYSIIKASR